MSINVICPQLSCAKAVVAPNSARGKKVRCVHCGALFLVPNQIVPQKQEADSDSDSDGNEHYFNRKTKGTGSSRGRR